MASEAQILEQVTGHLGEIQSKLSNFDINFKPFTSRSLANFNRFDLKTRIGLVQILSSVTRLLNSAPKLSTPENLDVHLIQEICQELDLEEPTDFIQLLQPNDIIEIYNGPEKIQVFRNFTFLKYCSYDLLTLLSTPYPELYWREERFGSLITEISEEVWRTATEARKWQIEDHVIYEKQGASNLRFKMNLKHVGPVFRKDGSRFGWISSIQVMPLGSAYDDLGNVVSLDSRIALRK